MPSSYVNNLRLEEIATGEQSGTWGDTTNTNLELIAGAFSYGTETIADSDTTITMADGAADAARSFYLKIASSADLTATRTITLAPNTVSKVWIIENATTGSQSITISQGSGASVTIASGQVKMIVTDGGGSGAIVYDTLQDLAIPDLFVDDDLTVGDDVSLTSDGAVIKFGADSEIQLTHVADTGLLLTETGGGNPTIQFRDAALSVSSSADGQLDIAADTELQIDAPTVDINAGTTVTVDTTTLVLTGNMTVSGTVDGRDVSVDGAKLDGIEAGADVTDATNVDAAGGALKAGTTFTGDVNFDGATAGRDIVFDRSDNALEFANNAKATFGSGDYLTISSSGSDQSIVNTTGTFFLQGDAITFRSNTGTETLATMNVNDSVDLYYDNSKVFETISGGVTVSGNNPIIKMEDSDTSNVGRFVLDNDALRIEADIDGAVSASKIKLKVDNAVLATLDADSTFELQGAEPEYRLLDTDAGNMNGALVLGANAMRLEADRDNTHTGSKIILRIDGSNKFIIDDAGQTFFYGSEDVPSASRAGVAIIDDATDGNDQLAISVGATSSTRYAVRFYNASGEVGRIRLNSTSTSYLTTSDYRLKQNVEYSWNATERLLRLKPATYVFKSDPSKTVEGFLAHELQEVCPEAVSGEKDGAEMQGVDHSLIVPLLVKTIQELEARITELENARG